MKTSEHDPNVAAQVGEYFDKASVIFDTFYDDQRSPLMRWVDHHFRRDIYERFERTFVAITPLDGKTVLDVGCGSGPFAVECARRAIRRKDKAQGTSERTLQATGPGEFTSCRISGCQTTCSANHWSQVGISRILHRRRYSI